MSQAKTSTNRSLAGGAELPTPFTISHERMQPDAALADEKVLGVFSYGAAHSGAHDSRLLEVPLEFLGEPVQIDVLHSTQPVEHGIFEGIDYACNTEVLLAQLTVEAPPQGDVVAQTFEAYRRIHEFLDAQGYPYPLRLWNYMDDINKGEGDAEVYKRFCLGRARAIQTRLGTEDVLPAASAIGSHNNNGALVVHLLAARAPGIQIENARQVSAFHYPRQYGIRSPSFSRARVMHWLGNSHLYLSGTASVVGHESLHAGNCHAQVEECLRNIDTVLETATISSRGDAHFSRDHLKSLRVYLRNKKDLSMVQACIQNHLGHTLPVAYLLGDICRQDLLVEVDGLYSHPV